MVSNNSSFGQDLADVTSGGPVGADLIPGDAQAAGEAGAHLSKLGAAFDRGGAAIRAVDTGAWTGEAAERFRANYPETAAPQWTTAAEAFTSAGRALSEYARTLADAQQRAGSAQADLDQANAQSRAAAEAHNARLDAYNAEATAANAGGPAPSAGPPGAFTDPGAEARAAAQRTIAEAKAAVQAAGDRAAAVVRHAASRAPAQPGLISQALQNLRDNASEQLAMAGEFAGGVADGVVGMAEGLAWSATHTSGIAMVLDPVGTGQSASSTVAAAVHDPAGAADSAYRMTKTAVDVDQWRNNPVRAIGEVAPAAVGTAASGGAGVAAKGASAAGKVAKAEKAASRVGEAAEKAPSRPHPNRPAWHDPDWQPPSASRPEHVPHEDPMPDLGSRGDEWRPSEDPKPSASGEQDHHMPPAEQGGLDDRAPNSDSRGPGPQPDPGTHSGLSPQREAALQQRLDRVDTMLERRQDTPDTQYEHMTPEDAQAQRSENMQMARERQNLRKRLGLPEEY